jgi:hypothetical protein
MKYVRVQRDHAGGFILTLSLAGIFDVVNGVRR